MQLKSFYLLFFAVLIVSCKDDDSRLIIEQQKEAQKKEVVFNTINRGWGFLKFIKRENLGIEIYKADDTFSWWSKLSIDSNGEVKSTPCN